ncbi:MAG: hypothetical protein RJA70_4201 [Pseudomonadota bacterium]
MSLASWSATSFGGSLGGSGFLVERFSPVGCVVAEQYPITVYRQGAFDQFSVVTQSGDGLTLGHALELCLEVAVPVRSSGRIEKLLEVHATNVNRLAELCCCWRGVCDVDTLVRNAVFI